MRRALELAKKAEGFTSPNPMVGCVLVKDGEVVGEGWHERPGEAHAEAMALAAAGEAARGATAYVTLEPCNHFGRTPPCSQALIRAGVAKVVYGAPDPNGIAAGGAQALRAAGIEAERGPLAEACAELIRPWTHSLASDRPWVTAKLAMTLDGYTATPSGESKWITGPEARQRGHDLRQRTGGIIVGVETVLADDPGLDPRPEGREPAPGLKVVLDGRLRTPVSARLLGTPGRPLVIGHETAADEQARALEDAGAEVLLLPGANGRPDLGAALKALRAWGVNDVMIEGGGTVLGAAFDAGLVDEVWAFIAPIVFGGGRPAIAGRGPDAVASALRLGSVITENLGPDLLVRGVPERNAR